MPNTPGWQVRVVPNKYPALDRHEVVIHSARHASSVGDLRGDELELVARAWRERARAASAAGFKYVQAVLNEGRDAGASLPHSHSQLLPLPCEPPLVAAERDADGCAVCSLLRLDTPERLVIEEDRLVVTCPYAGRTAYELLIAPRAHEGDGFGNDLPGALRLLGEVVRRLHVVTGSVPLNAWLHTAPFGMEGHWHIEVVPRLTIPASLELGAGVYVNTLAPEEAAKILRAVA